MKTNRAFCLQSLRPESYYNKKPVYLSPNKQVELHKHHLIIIFSLLYVAHFTDQIFQINETLGLFNTIQYLIIIT